MRGKCLTCGKEFVAPAQALHKKYCSVACRNKAAREREKYEKSRPFGPRVPQRSDD